MELAVPFCGESGCFDVGHHGWGIVMVDKMSGMSVSR